MGFGFRIEQDLRSGDRRGTTENYSGIVAAPFLGICIDHANAGRFASLRIVNDAVDNGVRDDRQIARPLRSRQRRAQTRVIGAVAAAALAERPVLTSRAPQ